jgi:hypothetical protein
MSTLQLRRFGTPGALKTIHLPSLVALLEREGGGYVRARLELVPEPSRFNYDALASVLANPQEGFPVRLVDALHHIHEVADEQGMEAMLELIDERRIVLAHLPDKPTPADLAVQLWMVDPELVERVHAARAIAKPKSFLSWLGRGDVPKAAPEPDDATLRALETVFDDYFERRKRGRHSRVFVFQRPEATYFLVRHGLPMDRRGIIRDGESTSSFERPERYDVISYVPARDELNIHARTKGERTLYREQLGLRLFGNKDYFPDDGKYTLAPLVERGINALACEDIDGIEWVSLQEVKLYYSGNAPEVVTRRAMNGDLFEVFDASGYTLAHTPFQASFRVKFMGSKRPRTVKIKAPNVATYTREADEDVVSRWLAARGFLRRAGSDAQAA